MDCGTRFSWEFSGQHYMVFSFFSGLFDWIILILKLMTSQGVEGSWINLGGGGGKRHGWFRRECRNTLKPYLLPPILSPFFIKMCWRTLKRDSLQSYFLHLQHQTLAPSFAIVQTGSGLRQKILDIFVLETARVNGTDISESLRPTVTKKNILLVKVRLTKHSSV